MACQCIRPGGASSGYCTSDCPAAGALCYYTYNCITGAPPPIAPPPTAPPPAQVTTLSVEVSPQQSGYVEITGQAVGAPGRTVVLNAVANTGYEFDRWEITTSTPPPTSLTSCGPYGLQCDRSLGQYCCSGPNEQLATNYVCCVGNQQCLFDPQAGAYCYTPTTSPPVSPPQSPAPPPGATTPICGQNGSFCQTAGDCCSGFCSNVVCGNVIGICRSNALEVNCEAEQDLGAI